MKYNNLFYDKTCNVYRNEAVKTKGSLKKTPILLYSNVKVSMWSSSRSFGQTTQAVNQNTNRFEINVQDVLDIKKGDTLEIDNEHYIVLNAILHKDPFNKIDNLELLTEATIGNAKH